MAPIDWEETAAKFGSSTLQEWGEVAHQNMWINLFSLLLTVGVISCLKLLP